MRCSESEQFYNPNAAKRDSCQPPNLTCFIITGWGDLLAEEIRVFLFRVWMRSSPVVTKSRCHLITVCQAMQNNCSLQTVPSVNVTKTTPTLGANYRPRWQPQRGGQGLTVISPFSACSGPAESVCVWVVVKRCVLCSLQGCQPGISYTYWFLSLRKQDPSSSSHSTFRSAESRVFTLMHFFYIDTILKEKKKKSPNKRET